MQSMFWGLTRFRQERSFKSVSNLWKTLWKLHRARSNIGTARFVANTDDITVTLLREYSSLRVIISLSLYWQLTNFVSKEFLCRFWFTICVIITFIKADFQHWVPLSDLLLARAKKTWRNLFNIWMIFNRHVMKCIFTNTLIKWLLSLIWCQANLLKFSKVKQVVVAIRVPNDIGACKWVTSFSSAFFRKRL